MHGENEGAISQNLEIKMLRDERTQIAQRSAEYQREQYEKSVGVMKRKQTKAENLPALVSYEEAHDRSLKWIALSENAQKKSCKKEKTWWNSQLRKAHLTQGLKYPAGGIIGDKHSVLDKSSYQLVFDIYCYWYMTLYTDN